MNEYKWNPFHLNVRISSVTQLDIKMSFKRYSLLLLLLLYIFSVTAKGKEEGPELVDPDAFRSTSELITSRGFDVQVHQVITEDGYILTLHRIVNPFLKHRKETLKPILVVHGLLDSSATFVMNSPGGFAAPPNATAPQDEEVGNNLGFVLANEGTYDVWLANTRGTIYSQRHTKLDPAKDKKYWEFSFDEMIAYDLPAFIGHVLKATNKSSLGYIGHSQGTIIMFGLLASKPEYAEKIKPFIALAPVVRLSHFKSPVIYLATLPYEVKMLKELGGPFPPRKYLPLNRILANIFCRNRMGTYCAQLVFLGIGFDEEQLDINRLRVYAAHTPNPTSVWNFVHFIQMYKSGKFLRFDYGKEKNIELYEQETPTEYRLENIRSKYIALIYSENDWCADPEDVNHIRRSLKVPLLEDHLVAHKYWNHMDFVWGKECGRFVNSKILRVLKKAEVMASQEEPVALR